MVFKAPFQIKEWASYQLVQDSSWQPSDPPEEGTKTSMTIWTRGTRTASSCPCPCPSGNSGRQHGALGITALCQRNDLRGSLLWPQWKSRPSSVTWDTAACPPVLLRWLIQSACCLQSQGESHWFRHYDRHFWPHSGSQNHFLIYGLDLEPRQINNTESKALCERLCFKTI